MAPTQIPRPNQQPDYSASPLPHPSREPVWEFRPDPRHYRAYRPQMDIQHQFWLQRTMDQFHQLILWGESQPSNGLVRKVERPDGDTHFAIAYGDGPDDDLRNLLEDISVKHGEVTLRHDDRDSTGKHWIRCLVTNVNFPPQQLFGKATICVYSKLEIATIGRRWPPRVPGALKGAPEQLLFMPWRKQLEWLEPDAAAELRAQMEKEEWDEEHAHRRRRGGGIFATPRLG